MITGELGATFNHAGLARQCMAGHERLNVFTRTYVDEYLESNPEIRGRWRYYIRMLNRRPRHLPRWVNGRLSRRK